LLAGLVVPNVQNHSLATLTRAANAAGFSAMRVPFGGFSDIDAVVRVVLEHRPRLFGLSMQATEAALGVGDPDSGSAAQRLSGCGCRRGHFATLNAEPLLREVAESTSSSASAAKRRWFALLRAGMSKTWRNWPGLVFRDRDGTIRNGATPAIDLLPRTLMDESDQPVHLGIPRGRPGPEPWLRGPLRILLRRGISDVAETFGARYERRDTDQIADAIAALYHDQGVRGIQLHGRQPLALAADSALAWTRALGDALRERAVERNRFLAPAPRRCLRAGGGRRARAARSGPGVRRYRRLLGEAARRAGNATPRRMRGRRRCRISPTPGLHGLQRPGHGADVRVSNRCWARSRRWRGFVTRPFTCCPSTFAPAAPYFERVRRRGLLEGGTLCQRYRFADSRTALLAEALLGFPTRLEEYSVPVALYDLGYNLGVARRLLPGADVG